ncbi:MAG: hypothetical protein KME50_21090 [Nostoc desertorum CM1-VF14]|jgi:hypothetical protein|nr:hypothetical protein [Nostoc desertorum CM1-VF14]
MRLDLVQDLESVPDYCRVIRLARLPKDFLENKKVLAVQLEPELQPSTEDKESKPPHLSFWVEFLTTPEQAYNFLQERKPDSDKKLVLRLQVSEIRKVVGIADAEKTYPGLLDVIWVFLEKAVRDERPGAKGHSGIIGLFEQSLPSELTQRQAKNLRKDLRSKLAELASKDCFLLKE